MNAHTEPPHRPPGRFITFEGGEGAGKSTHVERLLDRLAERGIEAIATREPGGSPRAEEIRKHILAGRAQRLGPMAEALLFSAARLDHLNETIRPALQRGVWVVCDRFADSTRAYQGAAGHLEETVVRALERVVVGPTRPDLTLILDLPPEVGLARVAARRGDAAGPLDRFEGEGLAFHTLLRSAFRSIAAAEPERCVLIDAERDKDAVAADIWAAMTRLLPVVPADPAGA